jgi:divalent metal cation (Fe/Co/Zn/Cd) transporter
MRYIASVISGVGIFMMGTGLSWYHGIMGLLHPQPIESLLWVSGHIVTAAEGDQFGHDHVQNSSS